MCHRIYETEDLCLPGTHELSQSERSRHVWLCSPMFHASQPSIINVIFTVPEERLNSLSFLYLKNITKLSYEEVIKKIQPKMQRKKGLYQHARQLINIIIILLLFCIL